MRKLILRSSLAPGDILMLTAAVRDLHKSFPGKFITDVRTSCAELWENNPYITPLDETDPEAQSIECHYPLIQLSNQSSFHFINGYREFLGDELGLKIKPTEFNGDIHLSAEEANRPSLTESLTGSNLPYWLIVAGGKYDYTIKWWHHRRFQEVVGLFKSRILFAQAGHAEHFHPPLHGVIDRRGRTTLREMIQLAHHAQGVLCPVTFFMHLAAAVPMAAGKGRNRPCVVVAGGREPPQWEAYPNHQFIHTVGALDCCARGGCWRSRTVPIGDGDAKDKPEALCVDVVGGLPRCMDIITPTEVAGRIESYFKGNRAVYLTEAEANAAAPHLSLSLREKIGMGASA